MTRLARQLLVLTLALSGLAGCKGLFGTEGPPDDPLFVSKKPLEVKAVQAAPSAGTHADPLPPSNPYATREQPGGTRTAPDAQRRPVRLVNHLTIPDDDEDD